MCVTVPIAGEAQSYPFARLVSESPQPSSPSRFWRIIGLPVATARFLFGVASIVFLLAVLANIPLLKFLCLGYLLESSGRLAKGEPWRNAFIGLPQASRLVTMLVCIWIALIPARLVWGFWYDAYLIDPASPQTMFVGTVQVLLTFGTLPWIAVALWRGGTVTSFLWPLMVPWNCVKFLSKQLTGQPLAGSHDGLVGATKRTSYSYHAVRDRVDEFVTGLHLPTYWWRGLVGFLGTLLWLIVPTGLLIGSLRTEVPLSVFSAGLGIVTAVFVFTLLPILQVHYAVQPKLSRFLSVREALSVFNRAPLAHTFALLVTFLFAVPLFLLKIEKIPHELFWTLSIAFVIFIWPSRLVCGWAYRRSQAKDQRARLWFCIPGWMVSVVLSLTFVGILFFSRYAMWNGSESLFENHAFLLPAPFWQ